MATTILIYGPSGSGKTTQIGRLVEEVYIKTGKTSRIYTSDFGGTDTLAPYQELGFLDIIEIGSTDPWIFLNRAVEGYVRDAQGKWTLDKNKNEQMGVVGFESAHGIAQLLKLDMEQKAAKGISVGGDTNTSFDVGEGDDKLKIGTTKGFQKFAIPQTEVLKGIYKSFRLPAEYIIWTAGISKDEDDVTISKIVGPDVIGKALTGVLPKDFNYTFRIGIIPASASKPEEHVLYLGAHTDPQSGGAVALGNIRRPLDAPEIKDTAIKPADIVKALKLVREEAKEQAKNAIKKRIEAAQKAK